VDIRKRIVFMNAHSYREDNSGIVPYNLSIDANIEYRITNPLIMYKIEDVQSFVWNEAHYFLIENDSSRDVKKLQKALDGKFKEVEIEDQGRNKTSEFFGNINNRTFELFYKEQLNFNEIGNGILIERVVLTSYDNLISHRATQ
ncbi:hypothetical protein ACFL08_04935, partial [Patescibacteria group bacterium]